MWLSHFTLQKNLVLLYHSIMKRIFALFFLISLQSSLFACNLGRHEWQLAFDHRVDLPGPIIPAHEFAILTARFVPAELAKIWWVSDDDFGTSMAAAFRDIFSQWPAKLPFKPISRENLTGTGISSTSAILEPVRYSLRCLLFKDRLSDFRCRQLVIMQEGWLRLAMPNAVPPIAEQYHAKAWVSVFFFDAPVPGRILSINAYPLQGHTGELFLDENLVTQLLDQNLVERRPPDYVSPWPDGFPEINY